MSGSDFQADRVVTQKVLTQSEEPWLTRQRIAKGIGAVVNNLIKRDDIGKRKGYYNIGMLGYKTTDHGNQLLIALSGWEEEDTNRIISEIKDIWAKQKSLFEGYKSAVGEIKLVSLNEEKDSAASRYGYGRSREYIGVVRAGSQEVESFQGARIPTFQYDYSKGQKYELFHQNKNGEMRYLSVSNNSRIQEIIRKLVGAEEKAEGETQEGLEEELYQAILQHPENTNKYKCSEPKLASERQKIMLFSEGFEDTGETHFQVSTEGEELEAKDQCSCVECCFRAATYREPIEPTLVTPSGEVLSPKHQAPLSDVKQRNQIEEAKPLMKEALKEVAKKREITFKAAKQWAQAMSLYPKIQEHFKDQKDQGILQSLAICWFTTEGDNHLKKDNEKGYENGIAFYEQAILRIKKYSPPNKKELLADYYIKQGLCRSYLLVIRREREAETRYVDVETDRGYSRVKKLTEQGKYWPVRYFNQNREDAAIIGNYQSAIASHPIIMDKYSAYDKMCFAHAFWQEGDRCYDAKSEDEANAHYERAVALAPQYAVWLENREVFKKELHLKQKLYHVADCYKSAILCEDKKEYKEALENYKNAIADYSRANKDETLSKKALSLLYLRKAFCGLCLAQGRPLSHKKKPAFLRDYEIVFELDKDIEKHCTSQEEGFLAQLKQKKREWEQLKRSSRQSKSSAGLVKLEPKVDRFSEVKALFDSSLAEYKQAKLQTLKTLKRYEASDVEKVKVFEEAKAAAKADIARLEKTLTDKIIASYEVDKGKDEKEKETLSSEVKAAFMSGNSLKLRAACQRYELEAQQKKKEQEGSTPSKEKDDEDEQNDKEEAKKTGKKKTPNKIQASAEPRPDSPPPPSDEDTTIAVKEGGSTSVDESLEREEKPDEEEENGEEPEENIENEEEQSEEDEEPDKDEEKRKGTQSVENLKSQIKKILQEAKNHKDNKKQESKINKWLGALESVKDIKNLKLWVIDKEKTLSKMCEKARKGKKGSKTLSARWKILLSNLKGSAGPPRDPDPPPPPSAPPPGVLAAQGIQNDGQETKHPAQDREVHKKEKLVFESIAKLATHRKGKHIDNTKTTTSRTSPGLMSWHKQAFGYQEQRKLKQEVAGKLSKVESIGVQTSLRISKGG